MVHTNINPESTWVRTALDELFGPLRRVFAGAKFNAFLQQAALVLSLAGGGWLGWSAWGGVRLGWAAGYSKSANKEDFSGFRPRQHPCTCQSLTGFPSQFRIQGSPTMAMVSMEADSRLINF